MVFDQGFWEADHNLWESVQKVNQPLLFQIDFEIV